MPKKSDAPFIQKRWAGGISDYPKENAAGQVPNSFYFGYAVNFRDDPQAVTLMPSSVKESGSVVTDFIKWMDRTPVQLTTFAIGDSGNFYQRTNSALWSNLGMIAGNHGNGLSYFTGDDYVYIANDASLARYGPTQNNPQLTPNFLKAEGGVAINTNSFFFVASSSQYLTAADSGTLEITGNITLESEFYANSFPTVGNSMTLFGKWDESGATRGYKLDLFAASGYFGAGTDGSLTISTNTTDSPINSACTGTSESQSLTATNASFAIGQIILIHQTQGSMAGQYELQTIQGYTAGTITTAAPLANTYTTGAQVQVLHQYTNVTINTGITWTASAWNGTTGGILAFLANGTITVTGSIVADKCGFRGGTSVVNSQQGYQGEGITGVGGASNSPEGNGGGGGTLSSNLLGQAQGGGGGNGSAGQQGGVDQNTRTGGQGGNIAGANDLTTMVFGGGGGGGAQQSGGSSTNGQNGGGIIFMIGVTVGVTGSISSAGGNGVNSGASGAGGSILIQAQTATLGAGLISANGGVSYTEGLAPVAAGGGNGRIVIDYYTSYTGTTTPTINAIQDNLLVTTVTIQARIGISSTGSNAQYLTQNLTGLTTGVWNRLSVSWSTSGLASFYLNGAPLGTAQGTLTAINSNAALLYIGANKGASAIQNFFDGIQNDIRIWSNIQTASQIAANNSIIVNPSSTGLEAMYAHTATHNDYTANSNNLTNHSSTYSTNVPFASPTTRLDIDVNQNLTGNTYTLPATIIEDADDMLSLAPVNDPQASIGFYVSTKGTGAWTVTIHDQQNNVIDTQTIAAANIPTAGEVEFIFTTPWRVLQGKQYHAHLTDPTNSGIIVTGTASNFSTAEYTSYYGFLVTDTEFHPIIQFQYQPLGGVITGAEIIGNERYLAVWDGANYIPNFIEFTPGWHVRCFAFWREFLAIGMWRGGNIYDFDAGRIYFWNGSDPTFDFFIDVPEGSINAMVGIDVNLFFFAGYRGYLMNYQGSYFFDVGNANSNKLKRMPMVEEGAYTEIYPGAMTTWRSLIHFGLFANSNSANQQRGTYSYGTYNANYPASLSFDYIISTGNKGNTVSIGCTFPVGESLLVAWQDGAAYGVDNVNFSNPPASIGEIQTLIQDDGDASHQKLNFNLRADYLSLPANAGIQSEIAINRGTFTKLLTSTNTGQLYHKSAFSGGRGREYQIGAILTQTGGVSPTLLQLTLEHEDADTEEQV
jgi:hypothetical protein